jgi:hypothetical protein
MGQERGEMLRMRPEVREVHGDHSYQVGVAIGTTGVSMRSWR